MRFSDWSSDVCSSDLVRDHTAAALESACARALELDAIGYQSVRGLLLTARTQLPLPLPPTAHENVRGSGYYDAHASASGAGDAIPQAAGHTTTQDRKSTRLNSSH